MDTPLEDNWRVMRDELDDTDNPEVRNETSEERAILFLDVKRPMHQPVAALNDLLLDLFRYTPVV